jgi:DNA invertase Pin-like site-specific DNA recombinase
MAEHPQPRAAVYGRQSRGKEKSIAEQVDLCTSDAREQGWAVVAIYRDGTSASRYRRRDREEWARVVAAIQAREFDVLVLWSSSRGDRDLTSWSGLLDACRSQAVLIRITDDERTYDVRRGGDWQALATQGVGNAVDSDKISTNVKRGLNASAKAGRPPMGPCPYGYRRTYDPATGELAGQEPDPATAPIVRDMFAAAARSVPLSEIARDLNGRGIAPPGVTSHRTGSRQWYRMRVRNILLNPAYIGLRKHNGDTHPAGWEPLVTPETFYAVARILNEPTRLAKARPGRQVHLLTYLAECSRGHPLTARATYYVCRVGCVNVRRDQLDELVEAAIVEALADPKVYRRLRQAGELSDKEAQAARNEVATLTARLKQWRKSGAAGETSPASLAEIETDLTAQIDAARRRADAAALPPALRPFVEPGADVEARWNAATLQAKRDVIRALCTVTVRPVGRSAYVPVADRVDIEPRQP